MAHGEPQRTDYRISGLDDTTSPRELVELAESR